MSESKCTLPRGFHWLGKVYNWLPKRWRMRGEWYTYFADGNFSAIPTKTFTGWYYVQSWGSLLPWRVMR